MTGRDPALLIVADDLSGAADSAVALAARARTSVVLGGVDSGPGDLCAADPDDPHAGGGPEASQVVAVDTDSRYLPGPEAAARVAAAARGAGPCTRLFKKIDSTLRGNIGPEIAACLTAPATATAATGEATGATARRLAVVAPAFPATGRTVVDGRVRVDGVPLGRLHPERRPLADQLTAAGLTTARLPLSSLRDGSAPARLAALAGHVDAVMVDGRTEDDLARTVAACAGLPVLPVGSGGLAHHLPPAPPTSPDADTGADSDSEADSPGEPAGRPVLVCSGSRSATALAQREVLLREAPFAALSVSCAPPADAPDRTNAPSSTGALDRTEAAARLVAALRTGRNAAVFPDPAQPTDPARAAAVAAELASVAGAGLPYAGTLLATGGETARAVLCAAGVRTLSVEGEWEPGVVCMRAPGGLRVVTKAGSFGDEGTLVRTVRALSEHSRRSVPNEPPSRRT